MKVKDFWQNQAKNKAPSNKVTHRDVWQRTLEIEMIKLFLTKKRAIDIGCGNGYTTKKITPFVEEIVGIDYSSEMINRAKKESAHKNITYSVQDVLKLSPKNFGFFDIAISERCLINLESWSAQKKAIKNISSVLKKGGLFIFVEGLKEGRENLNYYRESVGLSKMPKVWHNFDFEEKKLLNFLSRDFIIEKKLHFGLYDFISRVIHPLLVAPYEPKYTSKINKIACYLALKKQELPALSRIIFLVLRKK